MNCVLFYCYYLQCNYSSPNTFIITFHFEFLTQIYIVENICRFVWLFPSIPGCLIVNTVDWHCVNAQGGKQGGCNLLLLLLLLALHNLRARSPSLVRTSWSRGDVMKCYDEQRPTHGSMHARTNVSECRNCMKDTRLQHMWWHWMEDTRLQQLTVLAFAKHWCVRNNIINFVTFRQFLLKTIINMQCMTLPWAIADRCGRQAAGETAACLTTSMLTIRPHLRHFCPF